jgi:hypothetical protein
MGQVGRVYTRDNAFGNGGGSWAWKHLESLLSPGLKSQKGLLGGGGGRMESKLWLQERLLDRNW